VVEISVPEIGTLANPVVPASTLLPKETDVL
jgi:hypothetical protein